MGERLPDGDCRQLAIIVRDEGGDLVGASIKFEIEAKRPRTAHLARQSRLKDIN